jgi:GNAT superfamily N-acetyltransferase
MSSSPTSGTRWELHIGQRVVVRVQNSQGVRDVLGDLLEATPQRLRVRTRRGEVDVERALIIAGHPVPPAPVRAAPPHQALSVGDLELLMAKHWQAQEQDRLGGWLLRATGGFTNRANSVLAVGEPGMPLDAAVLKVGDWYADRGLRPVAASPQARLGEDGAEQLLAADGAFRTAGWSLIPDGGTLVMSGATGEVRGAGRPVPAGLTAHLQDEPDPAWIDQYHYRGQAVPEHGIRLLTSAPEQIFASIRDGERVIGIARGSLAERWAGLTAMEVDPAHRRRGLALALVAMIARWGWEHGALSIFLQTADSNVAAQKLYQAAGFGAHHRYEYLAPPSEPSTVLS